MCKYFRKKLNPSFFQGKLGSQNYFEGWYFKVVDASSNTVYAIIPGISLDGKNGSHAFIQVINGKTSETYYINYDLKDSYLSSKEFYIKIGENLFTEKGMQLNIHQGELHMEGSIQFSEFNPWPVSFFSPGAMGWFAYLPFMQCYHGVVSFDHALTGTMKINGAEYSFDGGKGYIEKDWGKSFPLYYIWIQSNH